MGTTSEKLTYLNTTKGKIKDSINLTGANITTEPFRQYSTKLEDAYIDIINNGTDTLYNNFPKVSGEGTSLTLNNTYQAPMRNNLKGNTSQTGTPTPSSPIPVNVVSGDNSVVVCGKNLANYPNSTQATSRISITPTNTGFDYTITDTGGSGSGAIIPIHNIVIGERYILNFTISTGIAIGNIRLSEDLDFDSNYLNINRNEGTLVNRNYKYMRIWVLNSNNGGVNNGSFTNIQLEKGASSTNFEPYQGNTYNINLPEGIELCKIGTYQDQFKKATGKNLAPINLESETYNTLEITNNNNGTFTLYGNPTGSFGRDIATNLTLKAGTYTISANTMPSGLYIALDNEADTQLSNGTLSKTFTLASDTTYTSLGIWFTKNKDYDVTIKLQIEKSGSATEWQPKEGWYKYSMIDSILINGTQNVSSTNWAGLYMMYINQWGSMAYILGGFCDYFLYNTDTRITDNGSAQTYMSNNQIAFRNGSTRDRFYIKSTQFNSNTELKTWFGTNNTKLYYVLATPTNEPIPSNLINQLEEFYQAQSKNNQTNISQINNDLGFIISASALKKGV